MKTNSLGEKIVCNCTECKCRKIFETIETEELINLIQHGRLESDKFEFLKKRVGSKLCKFCFTGKHQQ